MKNNDNTILDQTKRDSGNSSAFTIIILYI